MDTKQQPQDVADQYLFSIFNYLSTNRGPLPAPVDQTLHEDKYAGEVSFRTTEGTLVQQLAYRAPLGRERYAKVLVVPGSAESDNPVVYVEVDAHALAECIAEAALGRATGRAWDTENDVLVILIKRVMDHVLVPGRKTWGDFILTLRRMQGPARLLGSAVSSAVALLGTPRSGEGLVKRLFRVTSMFFGFLRRLGSENTAFHGILRDLETGKL